MIQRTPHQFVSVVDYLRLQEASEQRLEYLDGEVRAMAGGTFAHGDIGRNMVRQLDEQLELRGSRCSAMNGDIRIYVESYSSFVYPDAAVVCGDRKVAEPDEHAYTNPTLVVEVLSKSSAGYDRGDKFKKYCSLPSFQEYVLIEQRRPEVDVLYRRSSREWSMITYRSLADTVRLVSIGLDIPMRAIYRSVRFGE